MPASVIHTLADLEVHGARMHAMADTFCGQLRGVVRQ